MTAFSKNTKAKSGFTLLELAMCLLIGGLILGAILAGQNLLRSAEIQSTIADINNFRTAYNQFKDKYSCIPGDCAYQSRFFDMENGDGNRYIECGYAAPWCPAPIHEHSAAFAAMKAAGFIRSDAEEADGFEPTRLRSCQLFLHAEYTATSDLYGMPDNNFMQLTENVNASPWHQDCLNPEEADTIDKKIDDGYAGTGLLVGISTTHNYTDCAKDVPNAGVKPELGYNLNNKNIVCTLFLQMD